MEKENIEKIKEDLGKEYKNIVRPLLRESRRKFYKNSPGIPPLMLARMSGPLTKDVIEKCLYNLQRLEENSKLAQAIEKMVCPAYIVKKPKQNDYDFIDNYGIHTMELLGLLDKDRILTQKAHNLYEVIKGRRLK